MSLMYLCVCAWVVCKGSWGGIMLRTASLLYPRELVLPHWTCDADLPMGLTTNVWLGYVGTSLWVRESEDSWGCYHSPD